MKLMLANDLNQVSVGISLTQSAIRLVSIDKNKQIKTSIEQPLPEGVFSHGQLNEEVLLQSFQELLAQTKLTSKYVAVALPEYYSYTRSHILPPMSVEEVYEALSWQLENILPLPKDSVYYDWKLIDQSNNQLQILVIAMPKETLDAFIKIFEAVDLKPISFEPSASVLNRVVTLPENIPTIIAEIGAHGSSATLVQNQISYLTVTNQFSSKTQDDVRQALEQTSNSIKSLINYQSNNQQDSVETLKVFITGEGANQEVAQWFTNLLQRPVELLSIPNVTPQFHQAYAASTVEMVPSDRSRSVNLLPDNLRDFYTQTRIYQKVFGYFKIAWGVAIVSVLVSAVSLFSGLMQTRTSSQELQTIETSNSNYSYNSQEIANINQSSQAIINLFPAKTTPVNKLERLYSLLSEDVRLTNITYERPTNRLVISGTAKTRKSLLDFVDAIKRDEFFAQADLPVNALENPENINFNLAIVLANN